MSGKKPLFSVGDYVVATHVTYTWGNVSPGDVGIVRDLVHDNSYRIEFPAHLHWHADERDLQIADPYQVHTAKSRGLFPDRSKTSITRVAAGLSTKNAMKGLADMTRLTGLTTQQVTSPAAVAPVTVAVPPKKQQRKPRLPKFIKDAQEGDLFAVTKKRDDHEFAIGDKVIYGEYTFDTNNDKWFVKYWNQDHDDYWWVEASCLKRTASSKVTFDSVILSDDKKQKILATIKQVDNHELIFEHWGFGDVLEKGKAISMLFYGPPGTGKTLMAQAIADQYNKKLKIVGSAEIESSEPGQAERNIKAFFEGTKDDTVLLFDECDSLVYSREQVGSILAAQVNQLLSSLESFEGIVIFTTNRLGVLDEAFNRRLSLKLEFDLPSHAERVKIWQRMMPQKAPLADDINWEALAEVELSGGYIKNVVLRAARMAAAEDLKNKDKKITMQHLVDALTDEVDSVIEFDNARANNHTPKLAGGNSGISRTSSKNKEMSK